MDFEDIEILSCNSFLGGQLIAHFLSGCENQNIKLELVFLLLPFVFKKDARSILNNANKNSTLNSAFLNDLKGKMSLGGLEKRLKYFHNTTQSSIIVASKNYNIKVDEYLSIETTIDYKEEEELYLREFFRSSHYLGKILSKNDIFDTFIKLGLKEI